MDLGTAARMFAVLALGAAIFAALMALGQNRTEDAPPSPALHPGGGPAQSELARCRDLGVTAIDDAACQKAWAEHRRRFLETDR